tara:strand:+ start:12179 stop:12709 length:531 start_codon:yes stop_codon:yes gene_type:complete
MRGGIAGVHPVEETQAQTCPADTRIVPGVRPWYRAQRFIKPEVREAVVAGEQALQPRGAGAHVAADDERRRERPRADFGMRGKQRLGAEAVDEHFQDAAVRDGAPDGVHRRVSERAEQHRKIVAPAVVRPKIVQLRRTPCLPKQPVFVEIGRWQHARRPQFRQQTLGEPKRRWPRR